MKKALFGWLVICSACSTSQKPVKSQTGIPDCISQMIRKMEAAPKQNPPQSIYAYSYNGRVVYYVSAVCCDQFSDLYDNNCNLLAHPDGGFTGKGDGKMNDFNAIKTGEKLVWKDSR